LTPRRATAPRGIGVPAAALIFAAAVLAGNAAVRWVCRHVAAFDCPRYWPLSVFNPRSPAPQDLAVAGLVLLAFAVLARRLERAGYPHRSVVLAGLLLVLGTTTIPGWQRGFVNPTAGGGREQGIQYWHDAVTGVDAAGGPVAFVRGFNAAQPGLREHSRTHPPGAVLVFYVLDRCLPGGPGVISVAIAAVAVVLSGRFFRDILRGAGGDIAALAGYGTLLFLLLPAVHVYYAATLDALIAALLLGAVSSALRPATAWNVLRGTLCVSAASFLTFGFVWVLPVLLAAEWNRERSDRARAAPPVPWYLVTALAILGAVALAMEAGLGFSYVGALREAARLENPAGFRLFAEPVSYLFTRLENVVEILVFFGPFLSLAALHGFGTLRDASPRLWRVTVAALLTLIALFATGAFRTGETARACLFVVPYLVLPVIARLARPGDEGRERVQLLWLVFAQTVLMQLFGNYFW
jgi:hypothetical protein